MNTFEAMLSQKCELESVGSDLLKLYPDKKAEIMIVVQKYMDIFNTFLSTTKVIDLIDY